MLGLPFHPAIAHLREYLAVVRGLLERGQIDFAGKYFRVHAALAGTPVHVPLPISALRPRMFRLAGEIADGAIAAWCPIPYLLGTALPELARGARAAGRARPPLVANVPVVWSSDGAAVRAVGRTALGTYLAAPAYLEMFETAGFKIPESRVPPDELIDELMVSLHSASDPEKELSEALHALGGLSGELRASAPRNLHREGDTA